MNKTHAKRIHAELNARYFNKVLPMPRFIKMQGICNDNGFAIMGAYDRGVIWYHRKLSAKQMRDTIAHEMAHQLQDMAGYFYGIDLHKKGDSDLYHGPDFARITTLMKAHGLKI